MRALAETLIKGRSQAVMVVLVAAMLPLLYWVSAAGVALITLRKGVSEGVKLLVWALLPGFFWMLSGDPSALVVISGTYLLAVLLRQTASWQKVLLLLLPIGVVSSFILDAGLGNLLDQIAVAVQEMVSERRAANASVTQAWSDINIRNLLLGVVTAFQTATMLGCLMLARSWQATLFNPGGFRQEFHQLRLPSAAAIALVALLLSGQVTGMDMSRWFTLLLLPLLVAGIALIHGLVSKRGLNTSWLTAFYLSLIFVGPYMVTLLVILALIDSLMDLRARLPAKN
ncbi:hypothetical protein LH51_16695 [Nitrincola sp. A-D6]|uniref:hypothetical protein n=1 Tax=Nitrincola sp. A-D6 TaxID=1545442 RepID=UPI00051FC226|nr:hypothetical protein [Nitrincola sp. A-D6]KGK41135.1 hypothetical protein LH51_16695 [Nitrincola sp. A-D6]